MLDPSDRQVYWEPLVPPPGYTLDMAVATTYSLDLQALLMAAVPMAFGSLDVAEDGLPDPIQALASLQRVARRTTVFCEQAQIAQPRQYSRLFSLLEPVVAEVQAPRGGVFHPKIWLARYEAEEGDYCYRLVVLSRNLTLDRSWDTMFVADGWPTEEGRNFHDPLVDFVSALPDLCAQPLDRDRREAIKGLAQDLRHVWFDRPESVSHQRYRPIGIDGYDSLSTGRADRRLVISPFLSDNTVSSLFDNATEGILISRVDALDGLRQETIDRLSACSVYYWLDDVADEPSDDEIDEAVPGHEPEAGETLRGLHAKIIVTEHGDDTWVLIGSANATDAAFGDRNVEFGVQLQGKVGTLGIDRILPNDDDEQQRDATLRNLLMPYTRGPNFEPPPDQPVEQRLRQLRGDLIALDPGLGIARAGDGLWDLVIDPAGAPHELPPDATVRCRPISRQQEASLRDASALWRGEPVVFERVSLETLTTFVLFEIHVEGESKQLVMNLPIREGSMPEEREDDLIARMIEDSDGFLRYLLMLLWDDEAVELEVLGKTSWLFANGHTGGNDAMVPLLEELVRAFSRQPERLDDIGDLVTRLRKTETGKKIVPHEFMQLWRAFEIARGETDA